MFIKLFIILLTVLIGGGLTFLFTATCLKARGILLGTHIMYGQYRTGRGIKEQDACDHCSIICLMFISGGLALLSLLLLMYSFLYQVGILPPIR